MLQPHTIKSSAGARHHSKRRGRGNASGRGNYSGHGGKGQTARSGGSRGLRLKAFKHIMQATPKLPGFHSLKVKPAEVRLFDLEKRFDQGATVTLQALKDHRIIPDSAKRAKILNTGELKKALNLVGVLCTQGAKEKIEKTGGTVK